jgi:hypothetical protein
VGLGKTLKIMFTQQIKCDYCGGVIVDGRTYSQPKYHTSETIRNGQVHTRVTGFNSQSQYMDGVGVLDTIIHGAKKHSFCSPACERAFKEAAEYKKNKPEIERQAHQAAEKLENSVRLAEENMRLSNAYMKMELEKNRQSGGNRQAPAYYQTANPPARTAAPPAANRAADQPVRKAANFCSKCGSPLKPNAHFCGKCGNSVN